jgi:hypothetical protein
MYFIDHLLKEELLLIIKKIRTSSNSNKEFEMKFGF